MVIPKNWYSSESKRVKKIPYRHFIKHLECTHYTYVKMPQRANKNINEHNGTQPKKEKSKMI